MLDGTRRASFRYGVLLITLVSLNCSICFGFWGQKQYQGSQHISAPMTGVEEILVRTNSGNITVVAAETNDCNVTARITGHAFKADEAKQLAEQTILKLQIDGNTLTVKAKSPDTGLGGSIKIDYEITIPPAVNLTCRTASGEIAVKNIKGNIAASTSFGNISAESINGRLQLNTSFGDIDCNGITSPYLAAKSSFGNIVVAFSDACPNNLATRITTSYGDIDIDIPATFAGEIAGETGFGKIKTEVPVLIKGEISKKKLVGKINSGDGWIDLETSFGSVTIK